MFRSQVHFSVLHSTKNQKEVQRLEKNQDRALQRSKNFFFPDYSKHEHSTRLYEELSKTDVNIEIVDYKNKEIVLGFIGETVKSINSLEYPCEIHIDYSSMPRSWNVALTCS